MNEVKVLGTNKSGKELAIRIRKGTPLWEFIWKDGGKIPAMLQGMWHETDARRKAKTYLEIDALSAKPKGKAKEES